MVLLGEPFNTPGVTAGLCQGDVCADTDTEVFLPCIGLGAKESDGTDAASSSILNVLFGVVVTIFSVDDDDDGGGCCLFCIGRGFAGAGAI